MKISYVASFFLVLVVASLGAQAQEEFFRCDDVDLTDPSLEVIDTTIQEIQSSTTDVEGVCFPSSFEGKIVRISGVVTANGATRTSSGGDPPHLWIQDGNEAYSGIEIFDETHQNRGISRGDAIEIVGIVTDYPDDVIPEGSFGVGLTTVEACSIVKQSTGNPIPDPVVVPAAIFNGGECNEEAEKYESMLVTLEDMVVAPCPNAATGPDYDACSANLDTTDQSAWDKYLQTWFSPASNSSVLVETDNHVFSWFTKCQALVGDTFDSITGVVTYESRFGGSWELIFRDIDDLDTCQPISIGAVPTVSIMELQQIDSIYGPTEYGTVPADKLSTDIGGIGDFPGFSCPPADFIIGPNATISRTHNLCQCFPSNYYDPGIGRQGAGTGFVRTTGIIQHLEGGEGGPFYMADPSCGENSGFYVYRRAGPDGPFLKIGDEIEIISKPYVYYGLEELLEVFNIDVLSQGNTLCTPPEITAEPYGPDVGGCTLEGEAYESRIVTLNDVTVTRIFRDEPNPSPLSDGGCCETIGEYYQAKRCTAPNGDDLDTCLFEVADSEGNTMLIDNKFSALERYIAGVGLFEGEGRALEVGDTFDSITGIIEHFRGTYGSTGGSYQLHPLTPASLVGCSCDIQ